MNPLDLLSDYLQRVERRLRLLAWTRGAALAATAALASTVILVLIANYFAFSETSVTVSRVALFVALALAIGFGLLLPLLRMNARRAAKEAEERFPQFEERLLTFAEASKTRQSDPFLELLAADTLNEANRTEPTAVAAPRAVIGLGSAAAVAVAILIWLGAAGPGFWGYGTALLWAGPPKAELSPFYDLTVEPGNKTIRKRADQVITARTTGFAPQSTRLFVKYVSASKWEETTMRPRSGGPGHEFLLSGVPESLDYYVEAGSLKSKTFKLTVVDLPSVKRIRVTYNYPSWTGMKPETEDPGGDLRAPEGTNAELAISTDRPLANGIVIVDDGTRIPIQDGRAIVPMKKDGMYYIAGIEQGEDVRLTDDYFIEARKDSPPAVKIRRPGRDARVSPIEEVTVEVEGQDDFGLQELKLQYSVNGGAEKSVSFLQSKGQKTADGRTVLYLEDFKMAPGDIVSLYASARDARSSASTNIFFIEAQPFERNYTQSQQSGGGGGGGEEQQDEISRRQKEIISATWNQLKDTSGNKAAAAENAKFLSGVQSKLRDQAKSLAARMRSRELAGANEQFKSFVQDMEKAVEAMGPASEKLGASKWQDALPDEQKALQHILRAEATFRDIQVAFGNRGGGGGGAGGGRELESLFDLELDTEKNQYESNQQAGGGGGQRDKEIDEALQKLEQLARRQQELAEQAKKNQQSSQQRWQQEMLRREAEELKRQMEQLTRGSQSQQQSQQGQQGQQGQSGQQQSQSQGQSGQGGQQQSQRERQLDQAIERLKQATKDMQNAASSQQNGSQGEAEARRAAERLQEARDMLSGMRQRETGDQVSDLARRTEELAERQQNFNRNVRQEFGNGQQGQGQSAPPTGPSREKAGQMAAEKESIRRELERVEKDMQQATRDLAGSDKTASSKMRRALGDLQQEEVQRNMRWSAEAIRRGLGAYTVMREATQTQALNDLRDKMKDIESSVGKNGKSSEKGLEQALQQTEALRRQMERLGRNPNGQRGQQQGGQQQGQQGQQQGQGQQGQQGQQQGQGQQGQGQQGQRGQQAGQQPGQQQGQGQQGGQQQGQQGQPGGQQGGQQSAGQRGGGDEQRNAGGGRRGYDDGEGFRAMNRGGYQLPEGQRNGDGGGGIESIEQLYREGMRDLSQLRQSVRDTDPEVERDVADLMREMQRLDPKRFPGNPELVERLRGEVIASLEQIELQLRRKLEDKQGSSVRSGAADRVPAGYANSVADYFRKLSK